MKRWRAMIYLPFVRQRNALFQLGSSSFVCKLFPFRDYFLAFSVDTSYAMS
jgi:hypothetical protein